MTRTWTHPRLGKFKYEDDAASWTAELKTPAFDAFTGFELRFDPPEIRFSDVYGNPGDPSPAVISLVEKVLADHVKLSHAIVEALWNDVVGNGVNSGMWWSGDMKELAFQCSASPPAKPSDFFKLMGLRAITGIPRVEGHERPFVEVEFMADFEVEHGVGILTDGERILGLGYSWGFNFFPKQ